MTFIWKDVNNSSVVNSTVCYRISSNKRWVGINAGSLL